MTLLTFLTLGSHYKNQDQVLGMFRQNGPRPLICGINIPNTGFLLKKTLCI